MNIVVFGSINMDLVSRTPRLPVPGETLRGSDFFTAPGGKGANQAVACARLGASVAMIGRVGEDVFGAALRDGLRKFGVDVGSVISTPGPSGVAVIAVDERGENSIVIIPGANDQVGIDDLERLEAALHGADHLLLQLEIPLEAVTAATRLARTRKVHTIVDPAPASRLPEEFHTLIDVITPNETEAAALVGFTVNDPASAGQAGEMIPGFHIEAVDTTAAGDAFNGALAVALGKGLGLPDAVRFANAAGALAATRLGAQACMPTAAEVEKFLHERGQND
jgi:ribokinase